jgi:peptidoglycan/LPS O-acetylase OafA/YrhL
MHQNIPSLTGLRFVAAITVVVSHTLLWTVKVSQPPPLLAFAWSLSAFGMTLFFVLSGFVIHMNYSSVVSTAAGLWNFFVARFARLYPLYFAFLSCDLLTQYFFGQLRKPRIETLPFYLTLTQSWTYLPIDGNALVYQFGQVPQVSWSISTEWFFYLAFPLLCFGITRLRSPRTIITAILALCVFAYAGSIVMRMHAPSIEAYGVARFGEIASNIQDGYFRWLAYFSPYVRVFEFALGCLTSALVRLLAPPTEREQVFGSCLLIGGIAGAAALQWVMFSMPGTSGLVVALHQNFGFAPFAAIMIFCCARYDSSIVRALSYPRVVLAGEASYSIYLSHPLVITAFAHGLPEVTDWRRAIGVSLQVAIIIATIIGLSLVLWSLIEMPARRAVRRWLTIPDRAAPKVAVTVVRRISARTRYRVTTEAGTRAK